MDFQTLALTFGNALGFLLEENEGIVAQGETGLEDMHKFLVYRRKGKIRVFSGDDYPCKPGEKFRIHDTKGDTLLGAAMNGEKFIIDDPDDEN